METLTVLFALVGAIRLVGAVVVDIMLTTHEGEPKGCRISIEANASKGRCIQP